MKILRKMRRIRQTEIKKLRLTKLLPICNKCMKNSHILYNGLCWTCFGKKAIYIL